MQSRKCREDSFCQAVEELVIGNVRRELAFLAVQKKKIDIRAVIQFTARVFRAREWQTPPWATRGVVAGRCSNVRIRDGCKSPRSVKARRSSLQAARHSQVREAQRASSRGLSRNEAPRNLALPQNRPPRR